MPSLTVRELQEQDPHRFEKEYCKWCEHEPYDDWWDSVKEMYVEKYEPLGVRIDNIYFDLWRTEVAFEGRVELIDVMRHYGLDKEFMALALAIEVDGSYISVYTHRDRYMRLSVQEQLHYSEPCGIFADLPTDAWQEMVDDEWARAGLEAATKEWCEEIASEIAQSLEAEYEDLTSEAMFIESCEIDEITFEIDD